MIYDQFGRPLTSLRISVTSRCNLSCLYCHREGAEKGDSEMTPEEIKRIVEVCSGYGIEKIKLTGGEPLVRKDIVKIIEAISSVNGIKEVSMTTNGIFLANLATELKKAGLHRVNISLDTLDREIFSNITRGGKLEKVLEGIEAANGAGLTPIKLNMVVMKGVNINEIKEMLKFASKHKAILQLIGLVKNEYSREFFDAYYYDLKGIAEALEKEAKKIIIRETMHGRKRYFLEEGEVEVVFPMHNTEFCSRCTRLRITADGKFKPCLMREDNYVDFIAPMRQGATNQELAKLFEDAVKKREPFFKLSPFV